MRVPSSVALLGLCGGAAFACESCEHPERDVVLTRNVRRMQPDAQNATSSPRSPLAWGQLNFLHTTDTHGWLEGHLKEKNYGADWGDYVSFVKDMRKKAKNYDVDLLVVDTGDLHDGAGLSDATSPNGLRSNPIFEEVDYDLLTIGNHELYVTDIAYETFYNFSRHYGSRYLTSNVQILNPNTSEFEYIGNTHKYFKTDHGLRIMAFGILYDFTGNSNVSKVIPAAQMVNQTWFQDALHDPHEVDLYLLIGHNPVRPTVSSSTFDTVFNAIRAVKPDTPVQIFGGHTHIRDFAVYDGKTTALESGRYCETLGWLSMSGLSSKTYKGCANPSGVPNPTMKAVKVNGSSTTSAALHSSTSPSSLTYFRRYLDWNRLSFEYHAAGSQIKAFDTKDGKKTTAEITSTRNSLNLTKLYGCAPQTWCVSCAPFMSNGSIYTVLTEALSAVVVNENRANDSRIIILNTGSVRFDLTKGPFTYDDSFIVSPFTDIFQYIPNVSYATASDVLSILNNGSFFSKRSLETRDFNFYNPALEVDTCTDPDLAHDHGFQKRSLGRIIRRQNTGITPGYTTKDDFGTDGDDTVHSSIPHYSYPDYFAANGSFPTTGTPKTVDLIFLDFIAGDVLQVLSSLGSAYTTADVADYISPTFSTNTYLPLYAQSAPDWQKKVPNCPVGQGVGYNDTAS